MRNQISRRLAVLAVFAIAMLSVASAGAATSVPICNQASPHFQGGGLVALDDPVDSAAIKFTQDLSVLPGQGEGLVNAARKSPSLTRCGDGNDPV